MIWLSRNKNIHLLQKKNNNKKQADTMENNWTQIKEQLCQSDLHNNFSVNTPFVLST